MRNCADKATTLRIVLRLIRPSGEALVCDHPYRRLVRPVRVVGALLDAT